MIRYTKDCLEAAEGRWPAEDHSQPKATNRPKTIQVFENPVLELAAKSHPLLPGLWFGPLIAWCWLSWPQKIGFRSTAELFAAGALGFSLFEYLLHRFVFHGLINAAHDPASRFRAFMAHGYHHEFPDDRMRLVMPPMISWPLAALFAAAYYFAFGPLRFFPILTGTMLGYLAYDWVHYYTHHFHPRGGLGKWIRVYHLKHHHQDPDGRFGISQPLWDVVFGTLGSKSKGSTQEEISKAA